MDGKGWGVGVSAKIKVKFRERGLAWQQIPCECFLPAFELGYLMEEK